MFQKKCERRDSMGCIVRTYFRGNWQCQGGVRNYYFFLTYTNFPTFFFKSLTPFTHLAHRSPIAQLSLASRVPSFCSPVHRGAVAKRLRGSSVHSTLQLRLLVVGLNYETKLLMARGCIYASEVDSIDVPFQVYLRSLASNL